MKERKRERRRCQSETLQALWPQRRFQRWFRSLFLWPIECKADCLVKYRLSVSCYLCWTLTESLGFLYCLVDSFTVFLLHRYYGRLSTVPNLSGVPVDNSRKSWLLEYVWLFKTPKLLVIADCGPRVNIRICFCQFSHMSMPLSTQKYGIY